MLIAHGWTNPLTLESFWEWRAGQNKANNKIQEGPWPGAVGVMGGKHSLPPSIPKPHPPPAPDKRPPIYKKPTNFLFSLRPRLYINSMQMCLLYTLFQLESLACQDLYQHVSHLDKQAFRGEIFQINRHDVMTYHPPPTLEGGPRRPRRRRKEATPCRDLFSLA